MLILGTNTNCKTKVTKIEPFTSPQSQLRPASMKNSFPQQEISCFFLKKKSSFFSGLSEKIRTSKPTDPTTHRATHQQRGDVVPLPATFINKEWPVWSLVYESRKPLLYTELGWHIKKAEMRGKSHKVGRWSLITLNPSSPSIPT